MEEITSDCQVGEILNFTETIMNKNIYHPTERLIFSIVMPFIIIFGLSSNVFLLFVIFKMESMRTITNVYLGSLAAADIIFLCTGPIINFIAISQSPISADRSMIVSTGFGCAMIRSPNWVTYHVSILLITAVTLEKYWAICKPMYYRGINNVFRTFKIVVGIWLSCIFVGFTFCGIFWSNYQSYCIEWLDDSRPDDFPTSVAYCQPMSVNRPVYRTAFMAISTLTVIIFFWAMIINIYLYTLIIHQIHERISAENRQRSDPSDANVNLKRTRRKQQMVHMLLTNAIVHFVLLVPSQLLIILGVYLKLSKDVYMKVTFAAEVMVALNSSINPIIYMLLNNQYRRSFYNSLMCCRKGQANGYTAAQFRPRSTKSTEMDG